jgi:hypothetical protein
MIKPPSMDTLGKAFAYLLAMAWAGTEAVLLASEGMGLALVAAFVIFAVGFVVVGCYPLDDAAVNRYAKLFFIIVAFSCLLFSLGSFGNPLIGIVKLTCAALLCLFVLRLPAGGPSEEGSHH